MLGSLCLKDREYGAPPSDQISYCTRNKAANWNKDTFKCTKLTYFLYFLMKFQSDVQQNRLPKDYY